MGRSERGARADAGMACTYMEGGGGGTVEVEQAEAVEAMAIVKAVTVEAVMVAVGIG